MTTRWSLAGALICALAGCTADTTTPNGDGPDDVALGAGKADGTDYAACELEGVVDLLNELPIESRADGEAARQTLTGQGVHGQAAKCLVWFRMGFDAMESCPAAPLPADHVFTPTFFQSIDEVDAVKYVGPAALEQLVSLAPAACEEEEPSFAVRFSPVADYDDSHAARLVELIDTAERSVDVAIYSFSDAQVKAALLRNADRILIRVLYDRGALGGRLEGELEAGGIEVRFVGQTMHHKFAIIDGPHAEGDDPADTIVATGTANWSGGAVTIYDEATFFFEGSPELALHYQAEFNRLWAYSQPVPGHEEIPYVETRPISEEEIAAAEDPGVDAIFTSSNFIDRGGRLSVFKDGYDVADRWVELIEDAETSIWLFHTRLRSVPVTEAILRKIEENPDFEIRVFTDNQEFVWPNVSASLLEELAQCYAEARTDIQVFNCEKGQLYSFALHEAFEDAPNAEIRLKYYAYNWHFTFPQMHMKSMIVDGRFIVAGSYNLSFTSEFGTFENVVILDGDAYPELLADVLEQYDAMWSMRRAEGAYDALMADVGDDALVPLRFDPIALSWAEVADYRTAVYDTCGGGIQELPFTAQFCDRADE